MCFRAPADVHMCFPCNVECVSYCFITTCRAETDINRPLHNSTRGIYSPVTSLSSRIIIAMLNNNSITAHMMTDSVFHAQGRTFAYLYSLFLLPSSPSGLFSSRYFPMCLPPSCLEDPDLGADLQSKNSTRSLSMLSTSFASFHPLDKENKWRTNWK